MPLNGKGSLYRPAVILGKQDDGGEIQVRTGDVIRADLEGLGGAGFWWYVEDQASLYWELIGQETRRMEQSAIGGPMLGQWFFQVKKKGIAEIKMNYYRKWEGQDRPADTFRIKLLISD
jgi:predicted secreted protein